MSDPSPSLGIGQLIQRTFALLFAGSALWGPALAFAFLGALIDGWMAAQIPETAAPGGAEALPFTTGGAAVLYLLAIVASLVLSAFCAGYLCLAAVDAVIGRRHGVAEYARQAARHLLPLVVLSMALGLLVGVGLVLFILPGIYFVGRYLPWMETVVFEDMGWRGLGRARDMTEGYRWPIAAAALLLGVATLVPVTLAGLGAHAISDGMLMEILFNTVATAFFYASFALFTALVYVRLREIREGKGPAEIAASIG